MFNLNERKKSRFQTPKNLATNLINLCARLMFWMMEMVSSASPPKVSATSGMKSVPEEGQAERLEVSLRFTPTCRAWPGA